MKGIGNAGPDLHDPWLNVVRGVAILAVVTVHAVQNSDGFTFSHGGKPTGYSLELQAMARSVLSYFFSFRVGFSFLNMGFRIKSLESSIGLEE